MQLNIEEIEKRVKDSYELPNNLLVAVPEPMVTVRTSTYQHALYIRQCIESVLMQKTTFSFEYIIGEDFSTDGTREIVFDYAKKYPDKIRVITADYNVGMRAKGLRLRNACRGKYIALCEGDDYWTDPHKLQKQVDFLEANEDYGGCSHNTRIIYADGSKDDALIVNSAVNDSYTIDDITKGQIYFHASSMVYRNIFKNNIPKKYLTDYTGDWFWLMVHADVGPIKYIDSVMSVYRIHTDGVWSKLSDIEQIEKNLNAILTFNKVFEYKYEENFLSLFTRGFLNICKDKDYKFYEDFFINIASSDLLKIIFYVYKDVIGKDNTILEKDNIIRALEKKLNGHDIITRLSMTWLGRYYAGKLKQYAFVRWIARWIWRK